MNDNFPRVGACYQGDGKCIFSVWAPQRNKVELIITADNEVAYPMIKDDWGIWSCKLENVVSTTDYFFQLDEEEKKIPDPASRSQPKGVHGPSRILDSRFIWSDNSWKGIPLSEMIIYEIHIGTFTGTGDFQGIISKLDYLKELGINAVELMPITQFPGKRNWGYDGVYPFAVHQDYGGAIGLKQLVDEAHRREIAIILDVVYNHLGPEGNYFNMYGPYFTDKYRTGWGSAINFDDAWCDGVRNYYWQNAIMWLEEFHIDGLRLDAVHAIWDFSAQHFIEVLSEKVKELERQTQRKKILIAEFDLNNPRYINPQSKGGYALDGQWIDEFHHALHVVVTGEKDGYYEDFGDVQHLAKSIRDSYVYTGQYSKHRKKFFGVLPEDNPYGQFVVFAQNHDQIGNRMLGDRLTYKLSFDALKLVAATLLLSPHVPLLFMGEEYGEKNPFQYFISHTDEELVKLVQEGRKKEFSYFNWQGEVPDPQAEETFEQCKLSWNYEDAEHRTLLSYYKYLIEFRKARPAMQACERHNVKVFEIPGRKIIGFERIVESDHLLILLNFEASQMTFDYSMPKEAKVIFDSSATPWTLDSGSQQPAGIIKGMVVMNAESALIFEL